MLTLRGPVIAAGVLAVALIAGAAPAGAVTSFHAAVRVPQAGASCSAQSFAAGPDGALRGFAACSRTDQNGTDQRDKLAYVELRGGTWRTQVLTRLGRPLATAQDTTGTYLLYDSTDRSVGLGATVLKRAADGSMTSRYLGPAGSAGAASIVASAGKWWAVWAGPAGGGKNFNLYEAGTLLPATSARRITDTADSDFHPALAARPGGGLVLAWTRTTLTTSGSSDDARVAINTGSGWRGRSLGTTATESDTDIASDGRHVYVLYLLDGQPVIASDESGVLRPHRFTTRSCVTAGRLAVSQATPVALIWQCGPNSTGTATLALERRDGAWSSTTLYPAGSATRAVDLISTGGRATGLFASGTQTFSRSQ